MKPELQRLFSRVRSKKFSSTDYEIPVDESSLYLEKM